MPLTTELSNKPPQKARPLSPHLQIYKPQLTSALSIFHRLSGIALTFGLLVLTAWLVALASGPEAYNSFAGYTHSILGQIILFGLTLAFFFHLCCGIRHLMWDAGLFMDIKDVYKTGHIALAVTIILTLVVWLEIYGVSL